MAKVLFWKSQMSLEMKLNVLVYKNKCLPFLFIGSS